jgi:hypothetical protein
MRERAAAPILSGRERNESLVHARKKRQYGGRRRRAAPL